MRDTKKILGKQNCLFQINLQIRFWLFFHKTNIFSFIHQKVFLENHKFNFPAKIYEIRKKFLKSILYFQRDLKICKWQFFHRSNIFCLLMNNVIHQNKNFGKKCWGQNLSSQEDIQIYFRPFFDRICGFYFVHQKRFSKNKNFNFPAKIYKI